MPASEKQLDYIRDLLQITRADLVQAREFAPSLSDQGLASRSAAALDAMLDLIDRVQIDPALGSIEASRLISDLKRSWGILLRNIWVGGAYKSLVVCLGLAETWDQETIGAWVKQARVADEAIALMRTWQKQR